MATPKPKPKSAKVEEAVKKLTGQDALNAYRKSLTPAEIAKVEALAKKALEKKYPGMFIPETRTTSGIKRSK